MTSMAHPGSMMPRIVGSETSMPTLRAHHVALEIEHENWSGSKTVGMVLSKIRRPVAVMSGALRVSRRATARRLANSPYAQRSRIRAPPGAPA
jgi:hypothetical protein